MIRVIGKLEYVGINGDGNIYIILSKESQDQVAALVTMIRELKGKDVIVDIEETRGSG